MREEVDNEPPLQMAHSLLCVALQPGLTMTQLAKRASVSQSSAPRNAQTLGQWYQIGNPGYDLVEAAADSHDTRHKTMFLTPKGRQFVGSSTMSAPVDLDSSTTHDHFKRIYKARMSGR